MRCKRKTLGIGAFLGMVILILDGKTAVQGAYDGIEMCIHTVIPSLFPFFVLSNLITGSFFGSSMKLLRPIGKLCGISKGMESILIPAFLGGYPVAAQTIAQAWRQGQISKNEAQRLLGFCNNPGPAFLFGMAASLFPNLMAAWLLWGIQIVSALAVGWRYPSKNQDTGKLMGKESSLTSAMYSSLKAMGNVCGWIILFRILITFLDRWFFWILPIPVRPVLIGMMELSNGCIALFSVDDLKLRFVICSVILTFGGSCVIMQILSAADGLDLQDFFRGKLMQTVLSILLAAGIAYENPLIIVTLLCILLVFIHQHRKKGSIPMEAVV